MNKNLLIAIICNALFLSYKNNKEEKQTVVKETGNAQMMDETFAKPKADIKTIGILLYDGYTTLDAMGPYQVLSEMRRPNLFCWKT